MINLVLLNKAFGEVTPTQFQMLYMIANQCSLKKSDSVEMYNGFMMDKMGLSVRMIQYNIKALEEKGFIKVERPIGRNASKKPNVITLCKVEEEKETVQETNKESTQLNDAINCIPYKLLKENKNISCCIPEGTSTREPETTQHVNKETTEWVGNLLQRGYGLLSAFKSTTDRESADEYVHELDKVIGEYQPQKDRVTERQWQAFMDFERNVDNAIKKKNIYFNGQDKEPGPKHPMDDDDDLPF